MQIETKELNSAVYKYTLFCVYLYIAISRLHQNDQNTLPKEGVEAEHFRFCTTYSEAWNGPWHLPRRVLPEVFLGLREVRRL